MKHLLLTTIAAVLVVGCGESQQPEPTTAKAPDISIHDAAFKGNIKAVKKHLAAGTDVNAKDDEGMTPLHWAAPEGHKEIAELLIAKGANVNAKSDDEGMTHLHFAAYVGRREIAELLIAAGADVNATDKHVMTPLHKVAVVGHKEIAELLIAKGGDVNAKDVDGETPLDLAEGVGGAALGNKKEITDLLRKHGGKTGVELSIHKAAEAGNIEAVKQHLAAGADVNAKLDRGYTALHYAAHEGHKEIAQLLIAAGADVNAKDDDGHAPLPQAAIDGHKEIVELLIGAGADVNAKVVSGAAQGKTPLDAANETNHPKTADLLGKHGGKTGEEFKAEGK